jgi:hypothetical protein
MVPRNLSGQTRTRIARLYTSREFGPSAGRDGGLQEVAHWWRSIEKSCWASRMPSGSAWVG